MKNLRRVDSSILMCPSCWHKSVKDCGCNYKRTYVGNITSTREIFDFQCCTCGKNNSILDWLVGKDIDNIERLSRCRNLSS